MNRLFCSGPHLCHHWFEDECSAACDRGEHNHGWGDPACTETSRTSSSSEATHE